MLAIWLFLAGSLLLFSREAMEAATKAAQVFCSSVLPSLFPMMVLGGLAESATTELRGRKLFLVLFGFCAGSPASARQAALLHHCSPFSPGELMPLLCMCGVMSPMFFTGTLGTRLGGGTGWLMLLAHWMGALATGCLCHLACYRRHTAETVGSYPRAAPNQSPRRLTEALPAAVSAAGQSLLSVLGAMMLFSIVATVVRALLGHLFPAWLEGNHLTVALLHAVLEVGGGSFAMLEAGAKPWLLCALCSFGGLSIWLQNLLFLGNMIRPAELLCWRMLHGALSGLCCFALLLLHA